MRVLDAAALVVLLYPASQTTLTKEVR